MDEKVKAREALSVLALASLVLLGLLKGKWTMGSYIAILFLCIGLFIPPLAIIIHKAWISIAHALGTINTKIMLTLVFFLFLTPLSFLRRLFTPDPLNIKPPKETLLIPREHLYTAEDLENPY